MQEHTFTVLGAGLARHGFDLNLSCPTGAELCDAALQGATGIYNDVNAEIAEAKQKETDLTRELQRRRDNLAATTARLKLLEGRPSALRMQLADALDAGAVEHADSIEVELAGTESGLNAARTRLAIEAGLVRDAEALLVQERQRAEEAIREKWRFIYQSRHDELRAELDGHLARLLPMMFLYGHAVAATQAGYRPVPPKPVPRVESPQERKARETLEFQRSLPTNSPYRDYAIDTGEPRPPQSSGILSYLTTWFAG